MILRPSGRVRCDGHGITYLAPHEPQAHMSLIIPTAVQIHHVSTVPLAVLLGRPDLKRIAYDTSLPAV